MSTYTTLTRSYFNMFSAALRGQPYDLGNFCHPEIIVTIGGNLPMSMQISGLDSFNTSLAAMCSGLKVSEKNGIYIDQIFEQDNRVLMIGRGLIVFPNGRIYNNEYAMWLRFRDGLIDRLYEDCDTALILTGPLGQTLKYAENLA